MLGLLRIVGLAERIEPTLGEERTAAEGMLGRTTGAARTLDEMDGEERSTGLADGRNEGDGVARIDGEERIAPTLGLDRNEPLEKEGVAGVEMRGDGDEEKNDDEGRSTRAAAAEPTMLGGNAGRATALGREGT